MSWWAQKLGAPAAPRQPSYAPTGHPGYAPPPAQQRPPGPTHEIDTSQILLQSHEDVRKYAGMWKGGKGTQTETKECPACGSKEYFSRANVPGVMNANTGVLAKPGPMCLGCGYNGREDWIQISINQGA